MGKINLLHKIETSQDRDPDFVKILTELVH